MVTMKVSNQQWLIIFTDQVFQPVDVPQNVWQHVLRCQDMRAIYKGGQEDGKHLSVIVPLGRPPYDSEILRQMYLFVCQNSCPTGINRKAIQLVFTLEDAT